MLCHQFFVFNADAAVTFHESDQPNKTEGVDLERLIRICDRGKGRPAFIDIILEFLWYFHV